MGKSDLRYKEYMTFGDVFNGSLVFDELSKELSIAVNKMIRADLSSDELMSVKDKFSKEINRVMENTIKEVQEKDKTEKSL